MSQVDLSSLSQPSEQVLKRTRERGRLRSSMLLKRIIQYRAMYLFLLPAFIVVMIFSYVPMLGAIMAFQDYNIVGGWFDSPFVGLKHFRSMFTDAEFLRSLINTVGINGIYIGIGFWLPIALAILIFGMKDTIYKRVTQTITYLPHFVSWVAIAGIVYKLLDFDTGFVNTLLRATGREGIPFMRRPEYFWSITIITTIWKSLGWNTIIYLAALSSIPAEQYEAATVDGANDFHKLIYITLPSIAPLVALMLIFTVGSLFAQNSPIGLDPIYNLRNAMVAHRSDTLAYYIYQRGVMRTQFSYAAAVGLLQGVVACLMVVGSNALSRYIRGYGAF
jgi:putative aldouronate transport system permease protein